jgi:hypothetical protein
MDNSHLTRLYRYRKSANRLLEAIKRFFWEDKWNLLDLAGCLLFIIGFILKIVSFTFQTKVFFIPARYFSLSFQFLSIWASNKLFWIKNNNEHWFNNMVHSGASFLVFFKYSKCSHLISNVYYIWKFGI